jgi:ABC-type polysaccharide/polyol phosphate transport system ATPase subunit
MSAQITQEHPLARARDLSKGPVAIEVSEVAKRFRMPEQRIDTLKERFTHPLHRLKHRELRALSEITFDIYKGEFFGIVGRNGSGKSTLLKVLASIYRPDSGKVRTAGRIAPFIELGVGFNPELTARENGVLNGVLMGLTMREARQRLDAVIEFAELEEFVDLKLKNYSSGMMVRLAFSIMVQADADIMLVDEVLAVGDASFAQKCMDVFHDKKRAGKTIVFVTHDMATVQSLCHRAMVLHDGELQYIGAPEDAALRYFRLNFAGTSQGGGGEPEAIVDVNIRVVHATLRDREGSGIENVEQRHPIAVDIVVEAARELAGPIFVFHIVNDDGVVVFEFTRTLEQRVASGQRVRLAGEIENRLVPGRYFLDCWVRQDQQQSVMAIQSMRLLRFVVYGTTPRNGLVTLDTDVEPTVEP